MDVDSLLIFIDFSLYLYCGIKKFCNFAREFISQLREGNRRTQAIDALRLLLFIDHSLFSVSTF